jgi:hypothetical protein
MQLFAATNNRGSLEKHNAIEVNSYMELFGAEITTVGPRLEHRAYLKAIVFARSEPRKVYNHSTYQFLK